MRAVWLSAAASIVLGAAGQLLFKRFASLVGALPDTAGALLARVLPDAGYLLAGVVAYLAAVLLWLRVLRSLPLAQAYPLLSLGYALVYVGAIAWLGEAPTLNRTLGTLLVVLGVALAAPVAERQPQR
ncbi:MAG: 4-amino-4-deoxy-L-arabinose-phospho-UDP flippase [Pseudomonadota bacterium]